MMTGVSGRWLYCLLGLALTAAGEEAPLQVSLADAMRWTAERHPKHGVAQEDVNEAKALLASIEAGFNPHLQLTASEARLTSNLRAQGFPASVSFFPARLGPFDSFDTRLTLTQTVFNRVLSHASLGSEARLRAEEHALLVEQDELMTLGALGYVAAKQAEARAEAAQAAVTLSTKLLELTRDQSAAGMATGVDLTRSEHRLSQDRYRLRDAESALSALKIRLKRLMGVPMDKALVLVSPLSAGAQRTDLSVDQAVLAAFEAREELKMLASERIGAEEDIKKASAEALPTVGLQAAFGPSGITPSESVYGTGLIAIGISVPIVSGGEIEAHKAQALSRLNRLDFEKADVLHQIEEDVRVTSEDRIAAQSLEISARTGLTLATKLYNEALDRFRAGVADTLEVVDAATALSNARSEDIDAHARACVANINWAAATGRISQWTLD